MLNRISFFNLIAMEQDIKKFKVADQEINTSDLIAFANEHVQDYLDSRNWTRKQKDAFMQSYSNYMNAISDGSIAEQDAGLNLIDSSGKLTNNPNRRKDANGWVANYLTKVINHLPAIKATQEAVETLSPFDANGFKQAFINKYFGGVAPTTEEDYAVWDNFDELVDGKRGTSIRSNLLADLLDEYKQNSSKWDFKDSAFADANDYNQRATRLSTALRNGVIDQEDYAAASALGISKSELDALLSTGTTETTVDQWAERRAALKEEGYDDATIERIIAAEQKNLELEKQRKAEEATRALDWQDFTRTNYMGDFKGRTLNLGNSPLQMNYFFGTPANDDNPDEVTGLIDDIGEAQFMEPYHQLVSNPNYLDTVGKYTRDKVEAQHLRAALYLRRKVHPEDFISLNKNQDPNKDTYILAKSIDYKTGTALTYDAATHTIRKIKANDTHTPILTKLLYNAWLKQRSTPQVTTTEGWSIPSNKEGGILKAQDGLALQWVKENRKNLTNQYWQQEADKTGRSVEAAKVGHQKAFTTDETLNSKGLEGMSNSDVIRAITLLGDLASVGLSYIPEVGNAAAGVVGVGTTAADAYADFTDDSMSTTQALKNLGVNLGLTALSLIPGGGTTKMGKIVKGVKNTAPVLATLAATYGLATDPTVQRTLSRLDKIDEWTTDDWKNVVYTAKVFAGAHNFAKSKAAGIKSREGVKGSLGKWGRSEFLSSKAKAAGKAYSEAGGYHLNESAQETPSKVKYIKEDGTTGTKEVSQDVATKMKEAAHAAMKEKGSTVESIREAVNKVYKAATKANEDVNWDVKIPGVIARNTPKLKPNILTITKGKEAKGLSNKSLETIKTVREAYGNTTGFKKLFANDIEHANGLSGFLGFRKSFTNPGSGTEVTTTQIDNSDANINKRFEAEINRANVSGELRGSENKNPKNPKDLVSKEISIEHENQFTDFVNQLRKFNPENYERLLGNPSWMKLVKQQYIFKRGGIIKAQNGTLVIPKWYLDLYAQQILGNENLKSHNQFAGETIYSNQHNEAFDLSNAYLKNKAYTDNQQLVEQDLNTYYNSDFAGKSLEDFVNGYNIEAGKIRNFWESDHAANTEKGDAVKSHNTSHRKMFNNRNNTTKNPYSIGYQENIDDIMGTSTWMRRMDRYEKDFDKLTPEEQKSRIHKIGDLGYVYKKANGDIAIYNPESPKPADEDKEKALKIKKSKTSPTDKKDNIDLDELANKFRRYYPDFIAANRLIGNPQNNRDVYKESLKGLKPTLNNLKTGKRWIEGDLATQNAYNRLAALTQSIMSKATNSDAALNASKALEGITKGNQSRIEGNLAYKAKIDDTAEKDYQLNKELYDYNHAVIDENNARLNAWRKSVHDLAAMYKSANWKNWDTWLQEQEYRERQKQVDYNNWLASTYGVEYQNQLANDPEILKAKEAYLDAPANSEEANQRLRELEALKRKKGEQYYNEYLVRTGALRGINYTPKKSSIFKNKKGGKINTERIKARTKDNELFQKGVKHSIDHHLKTMDNLSKSTLLAIKKAMNL